MKVYIDGKEINVPRKEMVIARNALNSFLKVTQTGSRAGKNNPALYLTTLLMMYKKSSELLAEMGIENMAYVFDHFGSEAKADSKNSGTEK